MWSLLSLAFWAFFAPVQGVDLLQQSPDRTVFVAHQPGTYLVAVPGTWNLSSRPENAATVVQEGILRDLHVVAVKVDRAPVEVTLTYPRGGHYPREVAPAFLPLYRRYVVNARALGLHPTARSRGRSLNGARYLIIVPDEWVEAIEPLAAWKTQKGMLARVVPLSEAGNTAAAIHSYVQNAYDTWDPKPEYLLLVGNASHLPFPETDNYYVRVAGNDIFNDILPGRFPAATEEQVRTMVAKALKYDRAEALDTLWYWKAVTIVREDGDEDDSIYYADMRFASVRMVRHGYVHIDHFFADSGHTAQDVVNAVTNGRSFVFYRGQGVGTWWPPFDVDPSQTNNGDKLPIIVSTTCATIDPYGGSYAGEQWMTAGTPNNLKGAVGFFGTTTVRSHVAHIRSAVAQGFFAAVFDSMVETYGQACENGRLNLYAMYADLTDYNGFTTLGDPEISLRTAPPRVLTAEHPATLSPSDSGISFVIRKGLEGPVQGALVCVYQDTSVYAYGYTNAQGQVTLPLENLEAGALHFTVTKRNFRPLADSIPVVAEGPYPLPLGLFVEDGETPSPDGAPNPGEAPYLGITVKNVGTADLHDLTLTVEAQTPGITLLDSIATLSLLAAGDSATLHQAWQIRLAPSFHDGDTLKFAVTFQSQEGTWHRGLPWLQVRAPRYRVLELLVDDAPPLGNGNGTAEPGENVALRPVFTNTGHQATQATYAEGQSGLYVVFSDPNASGPGLDPGDTGALSNPFHVAIAPTTPADITVSLTLALEAPARTYTYRDTFTASLHIGGTPSGPGPVGPDDYGYYIYDDTDTLAEQAPVFTWTELAPPGPGQEVPRVAHADAGTATLTLPFAFVFYGDTFHRVGIASNGFLELGGATYRFGSNTPIPDPTGPQNLVAPFWDDLDPSAGGSVYSWYDAQNHRWIVEWYQVPHFDNPNHLETFQVVLYDPAYWPTTTGDGQIDIFYETVSDPTSCTVGIEAPGATDGLQYVYNNTYAAQAAPLVSHRALRITTEPPYHPATVWVHTTGRLEATDAPSSDANGVVEPGDSVQLTIEITNSGVDTAREISLHLESLAQGVEVLDAEASVGVLAPHDTVGNLAFLLWIAPTYEDSSALLRLRVAVGSDTGEEYLELPLYVVGVEEGTPGVQVLRLGPLFPNPARRQVWLQVSLPEARPLSLALYDLQGRRVWYRPARRLPAGVHVLAVPLRTLPSGPYFLRVTTPGRTRTWKVLHLQ